MADDRSRRACICLRLDAAARWQTTNVPVPALLWICHPEPALPWIGHSERPESAVADAGSRRTDPSNKHFTGKLRDQDTGLDYFGARYFAGVQGRFLTPDWSATPEAVPYGHFETPQSLNLYAYVKNNPITDVDVDGHEDQGHVAPDQSFDPRNGQGKGREMIIGGTISLTDSSAPHEGGKQQTIAGFLHLFLFTIIHSK